MKKLIRTAFYTILSALLFISCDRAMVYDEFTRIGNHSWKWEDPAVFDFEMNDTSSLYNILINLRHTTEYPLSNLYMFVHVAGPSGQQMTDTINFLLAEKSGRWIGKGVGHLREIGYLYKKNTMFPIPGEYRITLEQAMRLPAVPVSEVGIRIERANP